MIKKYPIIGWREWVQLPDLGIESIKAKVDTGARTSSLHAFSIESFIENEEEKIRFLIHPLQHNTDCVVQCIAKATDRRLVTDSGGHTELRYVIETPIRIGERVFPIEITLTERENMLFRMLLSRHALRKRFLINPARSFVTTRKK